jgi:hypothetical protein
MGRAAAGSSSLDGDVMPTAVELTGVWKANDGALYFVRGLDDGSVTWAGMSNSGFHMGVDYTNVFKGTVSADGLTVSGHWADVPRGQTSSGGTLSLTIGQSGPVLTLTTNPAGTTGGFGPHTLTAGAVGQLGPQDTAQLMGETRRFDGSFGDNNPPCRDFTVMWGTVQDVHTSTAPKWMPLDDYFRFVTDFDGWGGDGDFDFTVEPDFDRTDPEFWTRGWIGGPFFSFNNVLMPSNEFMLHKFDVNGGVFQAEVPMYGRKNGEHDCGPAYPVHHTIPGWVEQGGWSVLANGQPIDGQLKELNIPNTSDPARNYWTKFPATSPEVELIAGATVRVTGVIAQDTGHGGTGKPEIHPVYAFDVVQDFSKGHRKEVGGANLTGAWHCDDIGTYYLREIGNTVWWLGLSCDQGRAFANVYQGTLSGNQIHGSWVDVPVGASAVLGEGTLNLYMPELSLSTELVRLSIPSPFTGATWTKLYDVTHTISPPKPG